jgi:hypothetical protein
LLGRKSLRPINQWGKVYAGLRNAASSPKRGRFFIAFDLIQKNNGIEFYEFLESSFLFRAIRVIGCQNGGSYGVSE